MGFFDRLMGNNSQPQDPTRRGFTNEISNESDLSYVMWRHPVTDFNTNTKLIVNVSETALFIRGGKIVGKYDIATDHDGILLRTSNYPGVRAIAELFTAGRSQFPCKVVFIRHITNNEIWGTPAGTGHIQDSITELYWNYVGHIGYYYRVNNAEALYRQFPVNEVKTTDVVNKVKEIVAVAIQSVISKILRSKGQSVGQWLEYLKSPEDSSLRDKFVSDINKDKTLLDFGIEITNITPDIDLTEEGLTSHELYVNKYKARKGEMIDCGHGYKTLKEIEIAENLSKNTGSAGASIMGVNLGMQATDVLSPIFNPYDSPISGGDQYANPQMNQQSQTTDMGLETYQKNKARKKIENDMDVLQDAFDKHRISQEFYERKMAELQKEYEMLF